MSQHAYEIASWPASEEYLKDPGTVGTPLFSWAIGKNGARVFVWLFFVQSPCDVLTRDYTAFTTPPWRESLGSVSSFVSIREAFYAHHGTTFADCMCRLHRIRILPAFQDTDHERERRAHRIAREIR